MLFYTSKFIAIFYKSLAKYYLKFIVNISIYKEITSDFRYA